MSKRFDIKKYYRNDDTSKFKIPRSLLDVQKIECYNALKIYYFIISLFHYIIISMPSASVLQKRNHHWVHQNQNQVLPDCCRY